MGIDYDIKKNNTLLPYTFCSMNFFLKLDILLLTVYNNKVNIC